MCDAAPHRIPREEKSIIRTPAAVVAAAVADTVDHIAAGRLAVVRVLLAAVRVARAHAGEGADAGARHGQALEALGVDLRDPDREALMVGRK